MKIKGKKIEGPNVEYVIIPRGANPEDAIVFHAQAVLSMEDFDALVPVPQAPTIVKADGTRFQDEKDSKYRAACLDYNTKRMQYLTLKSLEPTPGLEWETVSLSDPSTWGNLDQELKDSGISDYERGRIRDGIWKANCLSEERMEEARQHFLAGLAATQKS